MDKITRQALEIGRANADKVISFRSKALRRRSQAIAKRAAALPVELAATAPIVAIPEPLALAAGSSGVFNSRRRFLVRLPVDRCTPCIGG